MTLMWIILALSGVLAGLMISSSLLTFQRLSSIHGRRDVKAMVVVWAVLLVVFLLAPLARVPLGFLIKDTSSWRLFGIYGYTSVLVVFCVATCLVTSLVKGRKLLTVEPSRNGA
jgi:MFS family permease